MRRYLPLILACLLASTFMVAADPLYKWVDDQGNVHYSDKPQPGAQKMDMPKASTFRAPAAVPPAPAVPNNTNVQQSAHQPYTAIVISSPKDQDTVWNTTTVTVSVALTPALQEGDMLTISVDGKSQTVHGSSATFTDLERGEHDVTVTVSGQQASGTLTAQSVFYIQRGTQKGGQTH